MYACTQFICTYIYFLVLFLFNFFCIFFFLRNTFDLVFASALALALEFSRHALAFQKLSAQHEKYIYQYVCMNPHLALRVKIRANLHPHYKHTEARKYLNMLMNKHQLHAFENMYLSVFSKYSIPDSFLRFASKNCYLFIDLKFKIFHDFSSLLTFHHFPSLIVINFRVLMQ